VTSFRSQERSDFLAHQRARRKPEHSPQRAQSSTEICRAQYHRTPGFKNNFTAEGAEKTRTFTAEGAELE
jgi:hypothetical protein